MIMGTDHGALQQKEMSNHVGPMVNQLKKHAHTVEIKNLYLQGLSSLLTGPIWLFISFNLSAPWSVPLVPSRKQHCAADLLFGSSNFFASLNRFTCLVQSKPAIYSQLGVNYKQKQFREGSLSQLQWHFKYLVFKKKFDLKSLSQSFIFIIRFLVYTLSMARSLWLQVGRQLYRLEQMSKFFCSF